MYAYMYVCMYVRFVYIYEITNVYNHARMYVYVYVCMNGWIDE